MSSTGPIRWVNEEQVKRLLTWDLLLPAVTRALQAFSRGPDHPEGAVQPLRSRVPVKEHSGILLAMPGLVSRESLAVKILTHYPNNTSKGIISHNSIIILMHHDTGLPQAILQGDTITGMRTAAASAVATRVILEGRDMMNKEGGLVVAVLGAGVQALSHARVMAHSLKVKKIVVWARRMEAAEAMCQMLATENIPATAASTVKEAVAEAGVINCCTGTHQPQLFLAWVQHGAHINSVGAPSPNQQEMEEDLVRSAVVYTDTYEGAKKESGDMIASGATAYAEIGEVLLGTKPVLKDNKTTIFKSLGLAVEDAVTAQLVCDLLKAEESK